MSFENHQPMELMQTVDNADDLRFKFRPLFTELFFPKVVLFSTPEIMLDRLEEERVVMSPFCSPMVGATVQRDKGFSTQSFKPGYQKPKHVIDPSKEFARMPGEPIGLAASPSYRRTKHISNSLAKQTDAIKARAEWLAVNAITTGKNIIEGDSIERYEIDWAIGEMNIITQAGSAAWSVQDAETFDPFNDLELYGEQASGPVNIIVMGKEVWRLLRSFKKFREYLDTRRGSNSELELALKNVGDVVSFKGYYGDVALIVYSGTYAESTSSEEKPYLDPNMMVFGHTKNTGVMAYGAIQDQHAIREGLTQAQYYIRNWTEQGDPGMEFVQTHSCPQPVPVNINRFVTVIVA
ncbi:major capsid protein [Lelliottia sp. SL45]|uniref:major capsid protein n=1 Tax=Lelliottia sp. SL45 TaxID=2994665 RepID=UPI002DD420EC|nr:major capsid protein [Lelliottia sp. SL45]